VLKSPTGESFQQGAVTTDTTEGLLAAIVDSSDDAIISKNLNGIITSWNKSAERIFGYAAEEAIGQHITLIIPPDRRFEEDTIIASLRRGERIDHFETVRVRKDGSLVDLSLTISPVKDAAGRVTGASKVARDITDQKRTNERLRKVEKMAAAGQLAASLAHEINNPLSAVTNALHLLKRDLSLNSRAHNLIELTSTELARLSRIVKQTLSYHRVGSTPQNNVDVGKLVSGSLEVFAGKLRQAGVELAIRIQPDSVLQGFPGEIRQVLDNLILNAIESMPKGGRLLVSVHNSINWRSNKSGVRVTLADTGYGISREVRARIFEPFFTTKTDKGTGLGLWVVHGLVEKHEGSIELRSSCRTARSGTVVSIFWPLWGAQLREDVKKLVDAAA
jgi:two-component system, chemotaxis family, CheB/CheR fusion protein